MHNLLCSWGYAPPHGNPKNSVNSKTSSALMTFIYVCRIAVVFSVNSTKLHTTTWPCGALIQRHYLRNSVSNKALRARVAPHFSASHLAVSFAYIAVRCPRSAQALQLKCCASAARSNSNLIARREPTWPYRLNGQPVRNVKVNEC